jgi:beta-glucosidase
MEINFPKGFLWGAATAAYQIEGGYNEDGRGFSNWDVYNRVPGNVFHGDTGDVAADHYHHWKEDVALMKEIGLPAYRFSFAWPRIIPAGKGPVNQKGLDFYDRLVDELLKANIKPFSTVYHWDHPAVLDEIGGWTNREMASYFADYASLLVEHFSDRITNWITINEPFVVATVGYHMGAVAPGMKDIKATAAATHHLLLGHGLAVKAMRQVAKQPLQIGITLNLSNVEPASDSREDLDAAKYRDAHLNRVFLDPLYFGKYPAEMTQNLGFVFPDGFEKDFDIIREPTDFLGINNYTRDMVKAKSTDSLNVKKETLDAVKSSPSDVTFPFTVVQPGGSTYSTMWEMYPKGLYDLLTRLKRDYPVKALYITENGTAVTDGIDADNRVRDPRRIQYLQDYITHMHQAIQEGVPVKGYFVWSLMDNYEWSHGYSRRFGIIFIDYENGQRRVIKDSAHWYSQIIRHNGFDSKTYYVEPFQCD